LRSLIVWLVLLAVPFQGFAAAAALPCAPATLAVTVHAHQAPGAMHDHGAMMHHGHGGHAAAASAHHDGPGHHAGAKCGSCAACWVGAAMMPAIAALGLQPASSATIPFAAGHLPAYHPSLPDRPPRSSLA
jgi:hypothetical protein